MIKIKTPVTHPNEATCDSCGAELLYENEDVHMGLWGCNCITCPCGREIMVSDRIYPPTFPQTFYHIPVDESPNRLSSSEIQYYVNEVAEALHNLKPGEFTCTGTADTMVYGFCFEDEDRIVVSKNEWEDIIYKE